MSASSELGDYLKARRARTRPETVGLPPATFNRRVPGLRREELAQLAGVSVDYYTRLEQGRHRRPSDSVIAAVATALGLDDAERAHLFDLAKRDLGRRAAAPGVQQVRPELLNLMEGLIDQPAFVLGRRTDVLASNPLARALITDWHAKAPRERNKVRWTLLDPEAKQRYPDWQLVAPDVVGTLRLDAGRYPDDPLTRELVGELAMRSEEFRRWWADHRVYERSHGTKRMRHHVVGELEVHYEALNLPADPDQTLFIYTTRTGSASHDAMRLLASWSARRSPGAVDEGPSAAEAHPTEQAR